MEKINKNEIQDLKTHMDCELQLREVMGDIGLWCLDHHMWVWRWDNE